MLFMVIETFADDDMVPLYSRLRASGRSLPRGPTFVRRWIKAGFRRCFQVMEAADRALVQEGIPSSRGTGVRFKLAPVLTAAQRPALVAPHLET